VKRFLLLIVIVVLVESVPAQESDVQRYIGMVNAGQIDDVRKEVPALLEKYPNNPGVLYVQALVAREGAEAARIYQSIVDNFPKSRYADAALFRVYQFYYALGLYRTAELKMNQLKQDYPNSRYLKPDAKETSELAEEVERPAVPSTRDTSASVAPSGTEKPAVILPPPTAVAPSSFTLQVGAYGTQVNAEKQRKFFVERGYSVELITKVRDTKMLFVVLLGSFATYDVAKAKGEELKKKYKVNPMVVPR
jgi:cell division protein FtsN